VTAGQAKELKLPLTIEVQQQQITVNDENQGVSIDPEKNAGAMVLKDRDLDALSDDPDELQNELQALAGPAAGPSGGQIWRQQLGRLPGPRRYLRAAKLFDCDDGKANPPLRHAPSRLQRCELLHIRKQRNLHIQHHCLLPGIYAGAVFRNSDKQSTRTSTSLRWGAVFSGRLALDTKSDGRAWPSL